MDEIEPTDVAGTSVVLRPLADRGVVALRGVFPPEWLQEQTEEIIQQWLPYITGDSDEFTILIPAADRLDTLGRVLTEELQEGDSYTFLFDDVITPIADYRLDQLKDEETGELPCGLTMSSEDIVLAIQPVVSSQWLQGRVAHVTDELVPYLAGEAESFAIHLPLTDRIEKSLAGGNAPVKVLLRDIDAYEKVYRNCVIPKVVDLVAQTSESTAVGGASALEQQSAFSLSITETVRIDVTKQELHDALQNVLEAVPPECIQREVEEGIDRVVPYVTGEDAHFAVDLELACMLVRVGPVMGELVKEKVKETYNALPTCNV